MTTHGKGLAVSLPVSPATSGSDKTGFDAPVCLELVGRPTAAPEVLSVVHGHRTILLDLRTERYLGLDSVGTVVWGLIKEAGEEGIELSALLKVVELEFGAPRAVLESDLVRLLDCLRRRGLIEGVGPGSVAPPPRVPSLLRCTLTLSAVTLGLRLIGLRRSLWVVRRLARRVPPVTTPTPELLRKVVRHVDTAAAFFPGRALCLEQSFALFVVLREVGIGVRLRIGAQPYPFAAHAWVEYEGVPVGEGRDSVEKFVPFKGLGV